jgi:hypothetical protein
MQRKGIWEVVETEARACMKTVRLQIPFPQAIIAITESYKNTYTSTQGNTPRTIERALAIRMGILVFGEK